VAQAIDIIGVGWRFPPAIDGRGRVALARHVEEIEEAIQIILSTPLGQRVMRPEFGCRIHELVWAPINASTTAAVTHYVEEALGRWEPRIQLLGVRTDSDPDDGACLLIYISYRVRATHDERALVYPFYTIPGEA
jgi:hypothetical protein